MPSQHQDACLLTPCRIQPKCRSLRDLGVHSSTKAYYKILGVLVSTRTGAMGDHDDPSYSRHHRRRHQHHQHRQYPDSQQQTRQQHHQSRYNHRDKEEDDDDRTEDTGLATRRKKRGWGRGGGGGGGGVHGPPQLPLVPVRQPGQTVRVRPLQETVLSDLQQVQPAPPDSETLAGFVFSFFFVFSFLKGGQGQGVYLTQELAS